MLERVWSTKGVGCICKHLMHFLKPSHHFRWKDGKRKYFKFESWELEFQIKLGVHKYESVLSITLKTLDLQSVSRPRSQPHTFAQQRMKQTTLEQHSLSDRFLKNRHDTAFSAYRTPRFMLSRLCYANRSSGSSHIRSQKKNTKMWFLLIFIPGLHQRLSKPLRKSVSHMTMISKNLSCFVLKSLLTCGNFKSTAMHLAENSDIDFPDQSTIFARLIRKVMRLKNIDFVYNKASNVHINLTLRRVRVTTFAVGKQYILHILSVCL